MRPFTLLCGHPGPRLKQEIRAKVANALRLQRNGKWHEYDAAAIEVKRLVQALHALEANDNGYPRDQDLS